MRRTAAIGAGFAGLLLLGQARQRSIAMAYSVMELLTLAVASLTGLLFPMAAPATAAP